MPASWHDHHAINKEADDVQEMYHRIVADKKPYFMRYIYPALMHQYNTYVRNSNKKAMREFGMSIEDLTCLPEDERTDEINEFLDYYYQLLPVGNGDCVMNRICRKFEDAFDGYLTKHKPEAAFDYSIMKHGDHYTKQQMKQLTDVYRNYMLRMRTAVVYRNYERVDQDDAIMADIEMRREFLRECTTICPDRFTLCDILLDLCYKKGNTKKLVWDMCGDEIIENLLQRNNKRISFPKLDPAGETSFGGDRFSMVTVEMENADEYNLE